jgi:ribosomal protein S6--L-glutamate ligase
VKVGITYNVSTKNFPLQRLAKALEKRGHEAIPFRPAEVSTLINQETRMFAGDLDLTELDLVFLRTLAPGTCDQITYRISAFAFLEELGPVLINSTYPFRQTKDKFSALLLLHKAGIPVPKTYVSEPIKPAVEFSEKFDEVVIKPLVGSQGFGVLKTNSPDLTYTTLKHLSRLGQISYVQQFVPHGMKDLRIFVIGGKTIASMVRQSKDWKSNIAQGAKPESIDPSPEIKDLAIKATKLLELDYSGVDIIEGPEGPIVLEVNAAPSWAALQTVTKVDIADAIVEHAIKKLKR